jgi:DNA-binding response OmpR family regulator
MTTASQPAIKTILLRESPATGSGPLFRFLNGLGHDVDQMTPEQALPAMRTERADLVIVDLETDSGIDRHATVLEQVLALPDDRRPRSIVVFADRATQPVRQHGATVVKTFVRPVHFHGLVRALRRLQSSVVAN